MLVNSIWKFLLMLNLDSLNLRIFAITYLKLKETLYFSEYKASLSCYHLGGCKEDLCVCVSK